MYTQKERRIYIKKYKKEKHLAEMRAIKKEVSKHLETIFDTDQTGYGEVL
jgi:hypothetical protein